MSRIGRKWGWTGRDESWTERYETGHWKRNSKLDKGENGRNSRKKIYESIRYLLRVGFGDDPFPPVNVKCDSHSVFPTGWDLCRKKGLRFLASCYLA
ncbi:hypothetical protein AVEN_145424-1 [Araneus ventricosus]|uniref:Uncharacterized protein n=1 Tax=Araneus ventricosus TaxID=182803 RepID=A0A4Y2H8Y5_ARAVE|nr:hypothetical protein AVEN_145424-1 [Araneus ventricosus]